MMFDLPFKLPEEWEVKTVEQLIKDEVIEKPLDGNHGGTHPKSDDYVENGIPFVMASDLEAGKVNLGSCKFITEKQALTLRKGFSKAGDVLISHKATIGRTAIVQENKYDFIMLTPQVTYYRIKNNQKLNNIYLKAYFDSSFFQTILGLWAGAGSTRAYLGITNQLKLPVIIPPIHNQLSIANHVGTINNKIELNRQTNQTLEQIAQALFKSWFVDFDPVKAKIAAKQAGGNAQQIERAAMAAISGKTEPELDQLTPDQYQNLKTTAALFPDELVESELSEIPEGWETSSLGEHFNVVMGQSPKGDTYNEDGEGMLFFQGRRDFSFRYPTPRVYTTDPKRLAQTGDTLISVRAPVGDRNMANQECCIGRGVASIRHKSGAKSFTYAFIGHIEKNLSDSGSDGTVFSSINKNELNAVDFIAPNIDLLTRYENLIDSIDQRIEVNSIEIETLESLRDSLLPNLLAGNVSI